jgi:hypothetical protein
MTRDQIDRSEMFQATNKFLDANAAIWSPIPVINTYKTAFMQFLTGIETAALKQDASQVFIGVSVRELKQLIAQKMDILDDTLEAYAADTENAELLSKAANSATDYFRLSHEAFEIKTKNVIDLIDSNLEAMADYGMSVAQVDEVKASFSLFQDKRGVPRSFQIESKIATSELSALFTEASKTLERLDNVMKRYKRSNPSFYQGYTAARTIIHH